MSIQFGYALRHFVQLVGSALVIAVLSSSAGARDFRSADVHPGDYPTVAAVKQMGKLLSDQTKGRLGVRVYPAGSLGTEKDNIEQLKIGGLDMMRINVGVLNSVVPETIVTVLPFVFRSTEHMRKVLDGPVGNDILAAMEAQGLVGLAFYDSGSRSFYTAKKPIKTLADMKGLKVRVQQSDLFVAMIEALGANPTPMPFGEVYTALKTGIVDAAENNWPSYESSRHFEAAKYYSLTEHSLAPEVLVFSKKVWDTLSREDQALIHKAAKDSVPYMRNLWDEREIRSRKFVEKSGTQTSAVSNRQEFIDAMKPVYAKFANTPKLKELVQRIQESK
ncbi:MAG: TRAP transporter substrate-binding protein [Burkholderiales bacterium]|nr:TRAP transporter substrate-binding protein [Burkholderiales bacterium]